MTETFKPNLKYSIKTPTGFQKFGGIRKLQKTKHFTILLSNGKMLKCSDNHPFIYNGKELHANDIVIGSVIDGSDGNIVRVNDIVLCDSPIDLYDIVEVDNGNIFDVDGIVSHNCDFITSGRTVVDGPLIKWYEDTYMQEPLEKRGFDGNYWVWDVPDYSKNYMVVADVARGDGADSSAFHVIEIESIQQVAEYKGLVGTKEYGHMLVQVATEWNDALLIIENAGMGWASIQPAIDRNYSNLYYTYKQDGYVDPEVQLNKGYDLKDKAHMVPGFTMSSKTRPLVISKLDTYMREKAPIIRSRRLIDELYTFIWNGARAEAQHGYNDDLVMSFSTGLFVRDTALKLRQQGIELTKSTLKHFGKSKGVYTGDTSKLKDSGWSQNIRGNDEDLRWLLK